MVIEPLATVRSLDKPKSLLQNVGEIIGLEEMHLTLTPLTSQEDRASDKFLSVCSCVNAFRLFSL